jgi:Ca2+-binding RTX toxin-like protein
MSTYCLKPGGARPDQGAAAKHPTGGQAVRGRAVLAGVFFLLVLCVQLALAPSAAAAPLTGGFSPTIINERADLNGDGVVNGRDDANAFYGDTDIIDGALDCNNWGATPNEGSAGNHAIASNDDCTLIGFDGTADGVTIDVSGGEFQVANGPLPTVFNAAAPNNSDIGDSDFAWSAINGRVDSNGDESITGDDCHFGLIGQAVDAGLGDATDGADILGNPGANECGFAQAPAQANNGYVDLNSDTVITAADSCSNNCFFGHDLLAGLVQQLPVPTTLDLTPATATNDTGTQHSLTAHVEDQDGNPLSGITVKFSVSGVNPGAGSDVTNGSGDAAFAYTGTNPGADTITAFADTNGNGTREGGEPQDTATKTWIFVEVATCPGFESDSRNQIVGTGAGETLVGTSGPDIICGLGGADLLKGKGGNDLILGGGGADEILGGDGADTAKGGGAGDEIRGGNGGDDLFGQKGNDDLFGQKGADLLNGGPGNDTCKGGPGNDTHKKC